MDGVQLPQGYRHFEEAVYFYYPEMSQDWILEQKVCGEPTRTLFLMFFDVRVTNAHSPSQMNRKKIEIITKCIMNIEHGTFTPFIFSVSKGMDKECSMFDKHVAKRLAIKTGERYEKIFSTIQCKLPFLILKTTLKCVRGS